MSDSKRAGAGSITCEDFLSAHIKSYLAKSKGLENGGGLHHLTITTVEQALLELVMQETAGNQSQAAHILGINRNTLRRKLDEYKIAANGKRNRGRSGRAA